MSMSHYSDDEHDLAEISVPAATTAAASAAAAAAAAAAEPEDASAVGCRSYPKAVWFILFSELCERFSYYGMKAVLIIYLSEFLQMEDGTALVAYHLFVAGCYFSPLLGGWVSDAYWGRYRTILYLSCVYIAGLVALTVSGVPSLYPETGRTAAGAAIGLILIAVGTGGIKPCVSAFGGDQITGSPAQLTAFFTIFYISINVGSLLSIIITPQLEEHLPANIGFVVSFGLPAALMALSALVLFLGRNMYKMNPPHGSVISKVVAVIAVR